MQLMEIKSYMKEGAAVNRKWGKQKNVFTLKCENNKVNAKLKRGPIIMLPVALLVTVRGLLL